MKHFISLVLTLVLLLSSVAFALIEEEIQQQRKYAEQMKEKLQQEGLLDNAESDIEDKTYNNEAFNDYYAIYKSDEAAKDEICLRAIKAIQYYGSILHQSVLDNVTINANLGTYQGGDFIALVDMTYYIQGNPYDDRDMIVRVSNTVASAIAKECPEVVELAVFWKLPKYESKAKIHFTIKDGHYEYGDDAMLPRVMVD